jgi:16S rRNA (cytosine1402-N4)-methyltransferase
VAAAGALGPNVVPLAANFRCVNQTVRYVAPDLPIHGVLLDLGVSSLQLSDPTLGLSFQQAGPLDMRLDRGRGGERMTAAVVVNTWRESDIAALLRSYGEEPRARQIAAAIVRRRRLASFRLTTDLASVVAAAARRGRSKIHPATRTFQALRMAVNDELANLTAGLANALDLLAAQGRLAVISFHSLEDRLVKTTLRRWAGRPLVPEATPPLARGYIVTKKPIRPSAAELRDNPRARSAKLRVFEKL